MKSAVSRWEIIHISLLNYICLCIVFCLYIPNRHLTLSTWHFQWNVQNENKYYRKTISKSLCALEVIRKPGNGDSFADMSKRDFMFVTVTYESKRRWIKRYSHMDSLQNSARECLENAEHNEILIKKSYYSKYHYKQQASSSV